MQLLNFILSSLALRSNLAPRQSATPTVRAVAARFISGDGCPPQNVGRFVTLKGDTIELLFDQHYQVEIKGSSTSPGQVRERFCRYEVTFEFEKGCTTGSFGNIVRGTATLPKNYGAHFDPDYVASLGSLTTEGPENKRSLLIGGGDKPVDIWQDYLGEHNMTVKHSTQLDNQRNVTYTAGSRAYLTSPDEKGNALLSIDSVSIAIKGLKRC